MPQNAAARFSLDLFACLAGLNHLAQLQIPVDLIDVDCDVFDGLPDQHLVVLTASVYTKQQESDVCALVIIDDPPDFIVAYFGHSGEFGFVFADEGVELADGVAQDCVEFAPETQS